MHIVWVGGLTKENVLYEYILYIPLKLSPNKGPFIFHLPGEIPIQRGVCVWGIGIFAFNLWGS